MKVLVTGGAGFIGAEIVKRLHAEGHDVAILDNQSGASRPDVNRALPFYHVDIRDQATVQNVFAREKPDAVCHYAARIDVAKSMSGPAADAEVNILGGLNVLEASLEFGVSRFVFASTGGAIYGNPTQLPVTEEYVPQPLAPYGVAKLAFEHYLRVYRDRLPSIVLRYANLYGPGQGPIGESGVIAIFTGRVMHGSGVKVYGDGRATRDYVYVTDAADAACKALASDHTGVYNIGSGRQTSVLEVIRGLGQIFERELPVEFCPARPGEARHIVLDSAKALRELGWCVQVPLAEGLKAVVQSQMREVSA